MDNFFYQEARRDYEDFMRSEGPKMEKQEKEFKTSDARMKYGKNYKEFMKGEGDAPPARKRAYPLKARKKA